jgi:dinuclear metal center YbgI/SA1388 family protein
MANTTIREVATYLDTLLECSSYRDVALNGLQVESPVATVTKVAFAVDAGLSVIESAVREACQLLVVHHGVFWGRVEPLTGAWSVKAHRLLGSGLSLYAAHLPLDGHLQYGNAARLAAELSLVDVTPFFEHAGKTIGVKARFSTPLPLGHLAEELSRFEGAMSPPLVLPFGKREISTVGIATGSATAFIPDCVRAGLDVLVTGEPKQEAYHSAKDSGLSIVCMGHYASETFGVRALQRVLEERFRVETAWISEPTGI